MTKASHLNRPSDSSAAAKAAKAEKRTEDFRKAQLPGLIAERQREYKARLTRAKLPASQMPMCNATMPGSYSTGDGEVHQQLRPGSQHAFTLPSHGDQT